MILITGRITECKKRVKQQIHFSVIHNFIFGLRTVIGCFYDSSAIKKKIKIRKHILSRMEELYAY